ncbi:MAG: Hsp70 family protein, partial [Erysipelotrichaceae bacterium]|nr:Hsp70 family protein [Erysipelotrichaceae bacterium]
DAEDAGQGYEAANLVREIKLDLFSTRMLDGKKFTARQIVGYILKYTIDMAKAIAEKKLINNKVEHVVISVPAGFTNNEKNIILEAATSPVSKGGAGLRKTQVSFIKEPVAAALSYHNDSMKDHVKALVYDFGGGTCDIALVESDLNTREKYNVLRSEMTRVGGKDYDERLMAYITREIEKKTGKSMKGDAYQEKIKRAAIKAKHDLSNKDISGNYVKQVRATVEVEGLTHVIRLSRETFDELTSDLFQKTINTLNKVIKDAKAFDVDRIICVGGSCNMPSVIEGLKREYPDKQIQVYEPANAIVKGGAIYAEGHKEVVDIAPYSYGIRLYRNYDKDPNDEIIRNVIFKNDPLPAHGEINAYTIIENQSGLIYRVFENEEPDVRFQYNDRYGPEVMKIELKLPPVSPKGTQTIVGLKLDKNGLLQIDARDLNGNKVHSQITLNYNK